MVNPLEWYRERKINKMAEAEVNRREMEAKTEAKTMEVMLQRSKVMANMKFRDYNPDALIQSKGQGLKLYQDMLRDPYVKAALYHKSLSITNNGFTIDPVEGDKQSEEIAEALEWNLKEGLRGTFTQVVQDMMKATIDGYSIAEKNWKKLEGKYKGKIGYHSIKGKTPYQVKLGLDEYNNITSITNQRDGAMQTFEGDELDKFVIYSYMPQYSDPHGRSDLRSAYRAFWVKDTMMQLAAVYGERYAMGFILAKVPANFSNDDQDEVFDIVKTLQAETAMVMPEGVDIEHKEAKGSAHNVYESLIELCNKEIVTGILGATLPMIAESGAREATREQGDTVSLFIKYLTQEIEDVIQEHIVQPWVDLNYTVTEYPKFKFQSGRGKDLLKQADIILKAKEAGVVAPLEWAYKELKIPMPKDNEKTVADAKMEMAPPALNPFMNKENKEDDRIEKDNPDKIGEDKREDKRSDAGEKRFSEAENIAKSNMKIQDKLVEQGVNESKAAFEEITLDVLKQIKKKSLKTEKGSLSTSDHLEE